MTRDMPLSAHVEIYKRIRAEIAADAGLADDDEAVIDTAEGETDLADVLTKILRASRFAAAQAKGIAELQRQMADRKARLECRAARLKAIAMNAMAEADIAKLSAPDFTASRGHAQPPLIVPDESAVPDEFCRIKREPDKTKIAAALKEANAIGRVFNFAYFGERAETLTVRSN